jgi:hypothetical protein
MRLKGNFSILAVLAMLVSPAGAATIFEVVFSGAQEVPPNASTASGLGTFVLNDAQDALSFNITYSGLTGGPVSGAHFHNAPPGVNGGVVRGIDPPFTSPDGVIAGVWSSSDAQPLTPALVAALLTGNIYFNIHTNDAALPNFPGGEIRAQLIPEPGTGLLLGAALLLGMAARRWRKASPHCFR